MFVFRAIDHVQDFRSVVLIEKTTTEKKKAFSKLSK